MQIGRICQDLGLAYNSNSEAMLEVKGDFEGWDNLLGDQIFTIDRTSLCMLRRELLNRVFEVSHRTFVGFSAFGSRSS